MRYFPTYESYRKAWDSAPEFTPKIPLNVDIELSSICNLKCPFCYITNPNYQKPIRKFFAIEMIFNLFKEIRALQIPAIKFNWIGEPTLHSMFNQILDYVQITNCYDVLINTNGNYPRSKNIGLSYATKVKFSLDSMNQRTYRKMRPEGNLATVLGNITDLVQFPFPNVCLARVITKDNQGEDFKTQVWAYFGNKVKVSEHYVFDRTGQKQQIDYPQKLKRKYCGYPSQRLVIDADGNIFPCCVDAFKTMKLGNIKENTLLEVWRSTKLAKIRQMLKQGRMPSSACKNCTSWASYQHPYSEAIKDKELWKMQ